MKTRLHGAVCSTAGMLLLASLIFLPAGCKKEEAPPPAAAFPAATVLAVEAVQKEMPVAVGAIGTVEAYRSVGIIPLVTGRLLDIRFREGDDVKKGQVLFTVDPAPYRERLRQAEATLAKDTAQKEFNEREAERYAFLLEKGAVSKSDAEKFRTDAAVYEAAVRADRAAVDDARLNLEYCSIRAPFDGRMGAYSVNVGAVVKANETQLAVINAITPIYVRFSIPERSLPDVKKALRAGNVRVKVGTSAELTGEVRSGRLVFLDNAVDTNTGMIQLKSEHVNTDRFLWPGQFVQVSLILAVQPEAVVVPLRAVQTGEKGSFVFVVKPDGTAEMRPVAVDRTIGAEAVIAQGVSAGETVVTDGHLKVWPGGKVEIRKSLNEAAPPSGGSKTPAAEENKK
ncbi:MAG: Multidrug resistance protein MdtA precursor [Syntrophaceae bacterium PtaU1.Bin231]|nr:MAG: Multidrug resistance protein MdtA precursor [Syntrophaceae bacterium PtaU1.Bin231]HOG17242.1 efflux RND transporter periplasmic adaptor subunit [Syntrophales bacterium]